MISSEVQRTLVKSPPELWAELSDPAALARHLGELGEIRIVSTEPESTVEWTAENTTGTVSIKPSGWGTKVTLSVSRETVEERAAPTCAIEPKGVAVEPDATATVEPETPEHAAEREQAAEPEHAAEIAPKPQPEPRRGFFARLFGRRRVPQPAEVPVGAAPPDATAELPAPNAPAERALGGPDAFAAVSRVLEPEAFAQEHPFVVVAAAASEPGDASSESVAVAVERIEAEPPEAAGHGERVDDISAELMAAESVAAEQVSAEEVTAVLTAVLDRLGAAHHRPFSRS